MEQQFKEIVARYCDVSAEDMTNDMSFRDDLGLSSLDLMTFLGDLEDEFDVEFDLGADEHKLSNIRTVGDALEFLKEYMEK
jgi:acyl carrier protein